MTIVTISAKRCPILAVQKERMVLKQRGWDNFADVEDGFDAIKKIIVKATGSMKIEASSFQCLTDSGQFLFTSIR